ncbi:endonuclease V [Kineosporia sp. NBRC 101731]|uniref:endonuclease V n=1 Tax=Kineosporia sp. NBRC 101731 TaxID=3032199 RepID=UPI0024A446DD|nr:endonuclease V [Kineosporia sp. NBRC 101731]GLY26896.1 endonuclease V [Kineosporia sp. NBRC 101731]
MAHLYAAADVGYPPAGGARGALVLGEGPLFERITGTWVAMVDEVAPYEPGQFYKRELPSVRAVLSGLDELPDLLLVDGFVDLDPTGTAGMGRYVHNEFGLTVIGVAKTPFRTATHAVEVCRGSSQRPLHVTAAGIAVDEAAALVRHLAGPHRIPEALRAVDRLSKGLPPAV